MDLPVDAARLWRRHAAMARIGATAAGGVDRPCLGPGDRAARALLAEWAIGRGFALGADAIGNLFITRPGRTAGPAVLTGSHMDSQPTGGRFDGIYGVLAGFEVLEALEDARAETARPVEVVAWTNEEGARFAPGCMGSMVFAGARRLEELLDVHDADGIRFGDALAETLAGLPAARLRGDRPPPLAYLEAHIEQGPVLERAGVPIGLVNGIQGVRWFTVTVEGASGHAGTTPHALRRDALRTAVELIAALGAALSDPGDRLRFTVGRIEAWPNVPNTIAARARFTIDLRHPDATLLQAAADIVLRLCAAPGRACRVDLKETFSAEPQAFDPALVALLGREAARLGLKAMPIASGAFHDALFLARIVPSAMIFVPCADGLSHHPKESADPADLAAGARLLAAAVRALAG